MYRSSLDKVQNRKKPTQICARECLLQQTGIDLGAVAAELLTSLEQSRKSDEWLRSLSGSDAKLRLPNCG